MYNIEIFMEGSWQLASSHTQEIDRSAQYQRFLDNGIDSNNLRTKDE